MRIRVTQATPGKWYRNYVNQIFDVEEGTRSYILINTPQNESIFNGEQDKNRKEELLRRMRNDRSGMRLGVNKQDSEEFQVIKTNREATRLLSKEW